MYVSEFNIKSLQYISTSRLDNIIMDAPIEPPACSGTFSTESDGLQYIWRGKGSGEKATSIWIYNTHSEQWTLQPTTGSPPPGSYYGGCASVGSHLYCFGGRDGSVLFNDLHKLNLETFQWSKVHPNNSPPDWPSRKNTCGFIAKDEKTLACFGGWAVDPTHSGECTWSNEFHLFHIQEGNYFPYLQIHVLVSFHPVTYNLSECTV